MLEILIKEIIFRLNKYIPEYEIISQDIDKNQIYPCFKINVIDNNLMLITSNIGSYDYSLAVNFYPNPNIDNRILLLTISERLNELFAFEFGGWRLINKQVINNEDFITCLLDYNYTKIYDEELELTNSNDSLIGKIEYEKIEKIEYKEEI